MTIDVRILFALFITSVVLVLYVIGVIGYEIWSDGNSSGLKFWIGYAQKESSL